MTGHVECSRPRCDLRAYRRGLCRKHNEKFLGDMPRGRVPMDDFLAHLNMLRDSGMSLRHIEKASGLSRSGALMKVYRYPDREWVRASTAAKLFAVQPDVDLYKFAPALGSQRRLRALVAIGYSNVELGKLIGSSAHNVGKIINGRRTKILIETAESIDRVFRERQMQPGSDRNAILRARNSGWHPPLAWDEESDLDDPDVLPDISVIAAETPKPPAVRTSCQDDGWAKVGGIYEERFEVSRDARVRTLAYETHWTTSHGKRATRREPAKMLSIGKTGGRPVVLLSRGTNRNTEVKLDRLVAGVFYGYPYNQSDPHEAKKWSVRHLDGDIWNCHADNLEWIAATGDPMNQAAYEANLAAWDRAKQEPVEDWAKRLFGDAA